MRNDNPGGATDGRLRTRIVIDDALCRLGLKMVTGKGSGAAQSCQGKPGQVDRPEPQRGAKAWKRRQQRRDQPIAHRLLPAREPRPGRSIFRKGGDCRVQVAGDAHAASVRSRMAALATGIGPCEACACQVEAAQGVAVFGKGKERGADVVDETRQCAFDRVKRAARPLLGLEEKHSPTVAGERRGCHEAVRASAHDDGVEHAWIQVGYR